MNGVHIPYLGVVMIKKSLGLFLLSSLLTLPALTYAEEVVILLSRSLIPYKQACHGYGDVSMANIIRLNMEGQQSQAGTLISRIASRAPDLVVTIGTEATQAVKNKLPGIPVVYTMVLEPHKFPGLASGGVLLNIPAEKKAAVLAQLLPSAKTVGILYDANRSASAIGQIRNSLASQNLRLTAVSVGSSDEVATGLKKFISSKPDFLLAVFDPTVSTPAGIQQQIQFAAANKIPFIGVNQQHVKKGALAALAVDHVAIGSQTAKLAAKIMQTKQSQPAQTPKQFILHVNAKTQKALGISALPSLNDVRFITHE